MDERPDALVFASVSIEADEGCGHTPSLQRLYDSTHPERPRHGAGTFVYTKILHHQVTRATFHRYAEDTPL